MKVCSVCQQCYDDTVTFCAAEDHGSISQAREGNRQVVEGYQINSKLVAASPIELYKATHLGSEKSVLIRFIKTDESALDVIKKELKAAVAVNHPNLARVYEFDHISGNELYVILEDVPGGNLRDHLEKKSPLLERNAIKIARQIAEGLEELHENELIHRAVNPSNIYFAGENEGELTVKLQNYDFGGVGQKIFAGGANGIDAKTGIFGYFSPEQFNGEPVDFKTDMYSLGVVFYEMLLGRLPYESVNPQAIENFVFDESDVEKLHFDLRALLGYTLRQSLQHRLNLRPPSTNNLSRQYRHLELIATPPAMGLQDAAAIPAKRKKPTRHVQAIKPAPVEKPVENRPVSIEETPFAELSVRPAEPVEPEIVAEESGALTEAVLKTGPSEEESVLDVRSIETIIDLPVPVPDSEPEISVQDENPIAETEYIPEPVETAASGLILREAENVSADENISALSDEVSEYEEIEEAVFAGNEPVSEDIHITNKDFDEIEEVFFDDADEFDEGEETVESEFYDEPYKPESPSDRHITNTFGVYTQPPSSVINSSYLYVAGLLAIVVFGGFLAARVLTSESSVAASSPNSPNKPIISSPAAKPERVLTVEEAAVVPEEISDPPRLPEAKETDVPTINEAIIKERIRNGSPSDTILDSEEKSAAPDDTKNAKPKASEKTASKTQPVKKTPVKPEVKKNDEPAKKTTAEKTKPAVKKADGMTRPRIVSNVDSND